MSKKYIIEIEEEPVTKDGVELWKACGFNALVFDQTGLDKLTDFDFDLVYDEAYQNGLDDAWEAAKKLVWETSVEELETMEFLEKNETCESGKVLEKYTAAEAIAKLKEYKEKSQKIEIGDEVKIYGSTFIVCSITDYGLSGIGLAADGTYDSWTDIDPGLIVKKTGRHFPEIAQLLEKMRTRVSK